MSQHAPYRAMALVPMAVELAPLTPFIETRKYGDASSSCPKCKARTRSSIFFLGSPVKIVGRGTCTGRNVGLCGAGCTESREHFHVRCRECGWRGLMAPADAK
jgi:hypothetical protein